MPNASPLGLIPWVKADPALNNRLLLRIPATLPTREHAGKPVRRGVSGQRVAHIGPEPKARRPVIRASKARRRNPSSRPPASVASGTSLSMASGPPRSANPKHHKPRSSDRAIPAPHAVGPKETASRWRLGHSAVRHATRPAQAHPAPHRLISISVIGSPPPA